MSDNQYVFEIIRDVGYAIQRIEENETLWMNVKNDGNGFFTARGSDFISGGLSETSRAIEKAYEVNRGRSDTRDKAIESLTLALKEIADLPSVRQDEGCNIALSAIEALGA